MSLLVNETFANPVKEIYARAGTGVLAGAVGQWPVTASVTQTIPIPLMTSTGLVMLMYVHPNTGGQNQYIKDITYGTNQIVVTLGKAGASPEYIVWQVLRYN